jgi:hypothetical protein
MDRFCDGAPLRFVFLVCAALAAPAAAQVPWNPAAPENRQMSATFNYGSVESVLGSIRARWQRSSTDPARPLIVVTFPNNRRAVITLLNCTPDGAACKGLGVQASWNAPAGVPRERLAGAIERFNQRYSFSKAFITPGGRPAVQRYLTADYGFIRGDLAVNLLVFANQADRFANEVLRPLTPAAG